MSVVTAKDLELHLKIDGNKIDSQQARVILLSLKTQQIGNTNVTNIKLLQEWIEHDNKFMAENNLSLYSYKKE